MKIKYDEKNQVVIATGTFKDKRIKVVSRCKKEDTYSEYFGTMLTAKKYKIAENIAKLSNHEKLRKRLRSIIEWCTNQILEENKIIELLNNKVEKQKQEVSTFINNYFDN